jgi:ABC-2 type transport system permease protein
MAGVGLSPNSGSPNGPPHGSWTAAQTRAQFVAIARLRWRMTVNAFRRKGGAGELIASILLYPLFAVLALLPILGSGACAYLFASHHHLDRIAWLLWATFVLCQLLNINLGQPGTTFDPTQLIRFPLNLVNFVAIRLFFGLLTPANIVGTAMSLAIGVGVAIAIPSLWFYALLSMAVFAAANVLFSRMVFAWVDRWLSTRRAREVFTGLIFFFSLGFQYLNVTFNPAYSHHHHGHTNALSQERLDAGLSVYHHAQPFFAALPPGLAASSLVAANQGQPLAFLGFTLGCAAFAALFLAIFALRMRTEFRGENLSEQANAVARKPMSSAKQTSPGLTIATVQSGTQSEGSFLGFSSIVTALLSKEMLYVRRNTGIFYSLVAPVVMVALFAGRLATHANTSWLFPTAVAYTLLGVTPLAYNSFGLEAEGSQFYFMAPVRLRDVFLAKNLVNFLLAFIEIVAVFIIVTCVAAMPSLLNTAIAMLWAVATLLLSTILGNRRSITAPKKILVARMGAGKQASTMSALISIGLLIASAGIAAGLLILAHFLAMPWLPLPIFAVLAIVAVFVYERSLRSIGTFALDHRDELFEELCKK